MAKVSRISRPRGSNLHASNSSASARSVAQDVGPVVYAARQPNGVIKIGYSTDIYSRLSALGGHKVLLALKPGTYDDEQAIHAALVGHLHHGREYYNATPEVLAVVNEMRAVNRMDPIAA